MKEKSYFPVFFFFFFFSFLIIFVLFLHFFLAVILLLFNPNQDFSFIASSFIIFLSLSCFLFRYTFLSSFISCLIRFFQSFVSATFLFHSFEISFCYDIVLFPDLPLLILRFSISQSCYFRYFFFIPFV